ncbi:signal recognition particle protein [candidate division TA06 bacterium]|uniref:Signal recognition particle protein n=1 Tax=candidate division TA06 bacterium TaxID=2250710 RepID=A0A523UPK6_UNCT6|nr:MAG: signal recognition particle protein [candidate division TA06 bacterium]
MFENLTGALETIFRKLRGYGRLSEKQVKESAREIRRALLEADVNYKVAKDFIKRVEEKALGETVLKSLTPGEQVMKIVYEEMVNLLGKKRKELKFGPAPSFIMLVGLQGSGKTTTAVKLADRLKKKGRNPLLVGCDVKRPAAIEQLKSMAKSAKVDFFQSQEETPVAICTSAHKFALTSSHDTVILDTAGRLHIDEPMMGELKDIKKAVSPSETILVADGMMGADAVNVAKEFSSKLGIDSVVLTKMDGDARGGAALSIRSATGVGLSFVGVGERFQDIEEFHPERFASRILGAGDLESLLEKAHAAISEEEAKELEKRLTEGFTLDDFLASLSQIKKMGSLEQILEMVPGFSHMKTLPVDEKAIGRAEAIINSMTKEERNSPKLLNGSRRRRIAMGAGVRVEDVNTLLKQVDAFRKMVKELPKGKRPFPF